MRRIKFSRSPEEASCGVRGELLNRGSGGRVPAPAPPRFLGQRRVDSILHLHAEVASDRHLQALRKLTYAGVGKP